MTRLLYLTDSYLYKYSADIIETGSNEFGNYVILDQTIFYPQGGGQPSDTGILSSVNGKFQIGMCRLNENGIVYHYGESIEGELKKGERVDLKIDSEKRIYNSRNHSAGHLVDVAIEICGYTTLQAQKGFHFPEGSYVEYHGELPEELEIMKKNLETILKKLSEKNIPIIISYENLGDLEAPAGKIPRFVAFEGYKGVGCGGTHVKNSFEIGEVSIRKMKYKKGILKVSYNITQ